MLQHFAPSMLPVPMVESGARPAGLVAGTLIRTSVGELPVEYLLAGDVIETMNSGMVELRGTSLVEARDIDVVRFDRPEGELIVPISQQVLVDDWRAQILHGQNTMLTPASSLVDEQRVTRHRVERLRLIRLHFDRPQVIWADGLPVASAPTRAPNLRDPSSLH